MVNVDQHGMACGNESSPPLVPFSSSLDTLDRIDLTLNTQ